MCDIWTSEEWVDNSQPAMSNSYYTLMDSRYNQAGTVVHTYRSNNGSWWGVLPGKGNYNVFGSQDSALEYLAGFGYDLEGKPTTIDELIAEVESTPVPADGHYEVIGANPLPPLGRSGLAYLV